MKPNNKHFMTAVDIANAQDALQKAQVALSEDQHISAAAWLRAAVKYLAEAFEKVANNR